MFLGRVKTSTVNTKDRKKADRGFATEAKRKSPSVSRASESDPDTFDAPTEATTRDTADKKAQRKPKKSRTAEAPASHSAPKYRETKAVTQSTTNLQCTYNGNLLFTVEEESNSKESRPKPADIPNPTPQTSSPGEEVAVESLTVLSTQAEDKQPVHEEDASPSHKEDVPNKSSTVVSAAVEQQAEDDNNKSSPIEQPMHESFEALSKGAEKPASVEEDVYCPSHREGVPDEPSTVLPTEEEKKQAEDEDAVPSPSEDCHAESSTVLPTDVELQQPVHCEDVCPSPKEEDFDAESSTSKPTDAEQQQPLPDNDQSSFLVEELSRKLSISDSLPTEKSMQHRPLHQASSCVRYVHLHEYERACPILTDDLLHGSPDDAPEEAGCVTPEPTRRHSGLLRDSVPGSPDDAPHEAECVTPEPTRRHSGLLRDSEPGSPDEALDDAECVTPEPTRRHSGLLRDTEPGSPDEALDDAECVTPEPTRRHSGLLRDSEPESPDEALDDAECVTPEPTRRHSGLLRDPALESPDEAPHEAECVTPEPTIGFSCRFRDDALAPESSEAVPAQIDYVTRLRQLYQLSPVENPAHVSPEAAPDEAECLTPEPTRRYPTLHRDPVPAVPESSEAIPTELECVTPVHCSPSNPVDDPVTEPSEAMPAEAECQTPVHEEIHQSPIDGSAHVSPACEQASTVKEEAAMTYEDYLNMLGKRPVHESANDLPLDADRRSPAHGGFSASRGCVHAHESSNALPVEAAQRSPARGHNHPNLRTTFVPESSSSSRPSGRSAPTDPMAPSGSGETPEIEIIEPLPSYWTGHPSSGVGNDDDLMCNLVAFSMFQEDGQADPDDFIRQQSLLLDAYRNARDVKDQQPVDNPAQVTQPSIPQQPPDGAWTGKIFFRECEITGATAECPISLPPQLTIEARVPMTYVSRMAENPAIKKIEHHFFQITPTVPNRLFHKLLRHLKGRKAAGVVHLQGFNITLYLVPALESSCMELGVIENPMNKLVCFLIAT